MAYADPGEPALARNCHDAGLHSPGYFIQNDGTGTELYVFNTPYAIVVTFRGLESLVNWKGVTHNLNSVLTAWTDYPGLEQSSGSASTSGALADLFKRCMPACCCCKARRRGDRPDGAIPRVHTGYQRAWRGVREACVRAVRVLLERRQQRASGIGSARDGRNHDGDHERQSLLAKPRVLITGHSMGGALAMLCALELRQVFGREDCGPMHLYTFGAPSIGDSLFVQHMERHFPSKRRNEKYDQYLNRAHQHAAVHYRVQYASDVASAWLWRAFGARHTGTLVWFGPLDEDADEGGVNAARITPRVIGKDPERKNRDAARKKIEELRVGSLPTRSLRDHVMKSYVPAVVSHFVRELLGEAPYGTGGNAAQLVQQLAPPGSAYVATPGVAAEDLGGAAQGLGQRRPRAGSIQVRNAALLRVASLSSRVAGAPAPEHSRVHPYLQQVLRPLLKKVASERCKGSIDELHEMAAQTLHSPHRWMHSEHDDDSGNAPIGMLHPKADEIIVSRKCKAKLVDVEPPFFADGDALASLE